MSVVRINGEVTQCKWCDEETIHLGTKECDPCWQIRTAVESNPDIAKKILEALNDAP